MTWSVVLFDLDGTLTHSELGITRGLLHTLTHFGVAHPEPHEIRRYLGPPLHESFTRHHGMSEAQAHKAVAVYREYYDTRGAFENEVYPGIPELLADLAAAGVRLAVATSKVEYAAVAILRHFRLADWFETVVGADPTGQARGSKTLVIREALARLGDPSRDGVIMVGDREHDIAGAAANGVASIGVEWGYADDGELKRAGAGQLAATIGDLRCILLSAPGAVRHVTA